MAILLSSVESWAMHGSRAVARQAAILGIGSLHLLAEPGDLEELSAFRGHIFPEEVAGFAQAGLGTVTGFGPQMLVAVPILSNVISSGSSASTGKPRRP